MKLTSDSCGKLSGEGHEGSCFAVTVIVPLLTIKPSEAAFIAPDTAEAKLGGPAHSLSESFVLGRKEVYTPLAGDAAGPYTLTDACEARSLTVSRSRTVLAGERSVRMTNTLLE